MGPCFHETARPQAAYRGYVLQKWRVAANILNKQQWTFDRGGPPARGLVEGLTTPHLKEENVTNPLDKPRNWTDSLVRSFHLLSNKRKVNTDKTNILAVVLYGCETWSLTLREKHRLRVFENKVLRKIFGAKRDEITGEWRKLHNPELHALHSSPNIIRNLKSRRLRWAEHVARMEKVTQC